MTLIVDCFLLTALLYPAFLVIIPASFHEQHNRGCHFFFFLFQKRLSIALKYWKSNHQDLFAVAAVTCYGTSH